MVSKTKTTSLIILILGLAYATSIAGLEISISSSKSTYLLLEPVLVRYEVKNTGRDVIQFRESAIPTSFIVTDSKNKKYPSNFAGSYIGLPPAFEPGESTEGFANLNIYGIRPANFFVTSGLPIGKYKAYLEVKIYGVDKKAVSNMIEFEIIEPKGQEKAVFGELLVVDSLMSIKDFDATYERLVRTYRKYPTSVYAQYCGSHALSFYITGMDKSELADLGREFIDKYPDSPHMSAALFALLNYYQSQKDKLGYLEELKSLIQKYPGTEVARGAKERLENLDKVKFSE